MVKNPPGMQETWVQSLGWEDPLEKGNVNPLQYLCLENPMDRGAWQATVRRVAKSGTRPKRLTRINQSLFNTTENGIEMILLFLKKFVNVRQSLAPSRVFSLLESVGSGPGIEYPRQMSPLWNSSLLLFEKQRIPCSPSVR